MDWRAETVRLKAEGKSWADITQSLKDCFPELNEIQVREKLRTAIPRATKSNKPKIGQAGGFPIGVFSDIHAPFNHPNYLAFIQDTFEQYKVNQIVCCGDIIDHHALSRFNSDPGAMGAYDEMDKAATEIEKYAKAFPTMKVCNGNHDDIIERQAATLGIGKRCLKSVKDIYGIPDTWEFGDEFIIDDVLYKHGLNCAGKDGALNAAIQERMSVVIGHSHAFGGCKYSANKRDIIFGLNAGCGIDIAAYAFAYGKHAKFRPTLGCGIVFNPGYAIFVPMGEKWFRSK